MGIGFGYHFTMFRIMFFGVFALVFLVFAIVIVRLLGQCHKNNNSPRLTVDAQVVAKRTNVSHHRRANAGDMTDTYGYHASTSTTYYVTFQFESGDRIELRVDGSEYGMLIDGDYGKLSFQGTRYLGFARY